MFLRDDFAKRETSANYFVTPVNDDSLIHWGISTMKVIIASHWKASDLVYIMSIYCQYLKFIFKTVSYYFSPILELQSWAFFNEFNVLCCHPMIVLILSLIETLVESFYVRDCCVELGNSRFPPAPGDEISRCSRPTSIRSLVNWVILL